jgi:hypothetical protein
MRKKWSIKKRGTKEKKKKKIMIKKKKNYMLLYNIYYKHLILMNIWRKRKRMLE